jgi:hypothetical protein
MQPRGRVPDSPAPLHRPAAVPSGCPSCRLSIIAGPAESCSWNILTKRGQTVVSARGRCHNTHTRCRRWTAQCDVRLLEIFSPLKPGRMCRGSSRRFSPATVSLTRPVCANFCATGRPSDADAELRIANQTIYRDAEHPSHVLLPVIPR